MNIADDLQLLVNGVGGDFEQILFVAKGLFVPVAEVVDPKGCAELLPILAEAADEARTSPRGYWETWGAPTPATTFPD